MRVRHAAFGLVFLIACLFTSSDASAADADAVVPESVVESLVQPDLWSFTHHGAQPAAVQVVAALPDPPSIGSTTPSKKDLLEVAVTHVDKVNGKMGRVMVKPPGYTHEDAALEPGGHYNLGPSRRRVGAGFHIHKEHQDNPEETSEAEAHREAMAKKLIAYRVKTNKERDEKARDNIADETEQKKLVEQHTKHVAKKAAAAAAAKLSKKHEADLEASSSKEGAGKFEAQAKELRAKAAAGHELANKDPARTKRKMVENDELARKVTRKENAQKLATANADSHAADEEGSASQAAYEQQSAASEASDVVSTPSPATGSGAVPELVSLCHTSGTEQTTWTGFQTTLNATDQEVDKTPLSVVLTYGTDKTIVGEGEDDGGSYVWKGSYNGLAVQFTKEYSSVAPSILYKGTLAQAKDAGDQPVVQLEGFWHSDGNMGQYHLVQDGHSTSLVEELGCDSAALLPEEALYQKVTALYEEALKPEGAPTAMVEDPVHDSVDITGVNGRVDPAKIAAFADHHALGETYSSDYQYASGPPVQEVPPIPPSASPTPTPTPTPTANPTATPTAPPTATPTAPPTYASSYGSGFASSSVGYGSSETEDHGGAFHVEEPMAAFPHHVATGSALLPAPALVPAPVPPVVPHGRGGGSTLGVAEGSAPEDANPFHEGIPEGAAGSAAVNHTALQHLKTAYGNTSDHAPDWDPEAQSKSSMEAKIEDAVSAALNSTATPAPPHPAAHAALPEDPAAFKEEAKEQVIAETKESNAKVTEVHSAVAAARDAQREAQARAHFAHTLHTLGRTEQQPTAPATQGSGLGSASPALVSVAAVAGSAPGNYPQVTMPRTKEEELLTVEGTAEAPLYEQEQAFFASLLADEE